MSEEREAVRRLVIAINNLDKVYTANTPKIGRQSSELWLMYALNDGEPHSQKQICDEWAFPRTTLNTVTKKCEAAGYLSLTPIPGKRREMQICLTEKGKIYADQLLDVIYRAEDRAMEEILKNYSADFVGILESFVKSLKSSFEQEIKQEKDSKNQGGV